MLLSMGPSVFSSSKNLEAFSGDEQLQPFAKGLEELEEPNMDDVKGEVQKEDHEPKRSRKHFDNGSEEREKRNSKLPKTMQEKKPSVVSDMYKKEKSMGLIFICNAHTKSDCFRYNVLGHPACKRELVAKVYKGMRLFLFDTDLRLMYGIFKATEPGGYNIEPKAFNSAYPAQVRFRVYDDCLPLPEERFRDVIKENYYSRNKFECILSAEQMKKLCKLFQTRLISNNDWTINRFDVPITAHPQRGPGGKRFPTLVDIHQPPPRASFLGRHTYTSSLTRNSSLLDNVTSSLQPPRSPSAYVFEGSHGFDHRRRELFNHSSRDLPVELEQIDHTPVISPVELDDCHQLLQLTRGRRSGLSDHELPYEKRSQFIESDGHYLHRRPEQLIDDPYLRPFQKEPRLELHDHRIAVMRRDGQIELQDRQLVRLQTRPQGLEGADLRSSRHEEEIVHASRPPGFHHEIPPWRRAGLPHSHHFSQ